MTDAAMEETLAALLPRVERIAMRFSRRADFDDLVQEGWIACWQAIVKGVQPSNEIIEGRMRRWLKFVSKHDPLSYEQVMEGSE